MWLMWPRAFGQQIVGDVLHHGRGELGGPAGDGPEHVDEVRTRLDLDQAEMVEQLQRWRHWFPPDVMIEPEGHVAHARAAAVADRPLAPNTRRALRGSAAKAGEFSRSVMPHPP